MDFVWLDKELYVRVRIFFSEAIIVTENVNHPIYLNLNKTTRDMISIHSCKLFYSTFFAKFFHSASLKTIFLVFPLSISLGFLFFFSSNPDIHISTRQCQFAVPNLLMVTTPVSIANC